MFFQISHLRNRIFDLISEKIGLLILIIAIISSGFLTHIIISFKPLYIVQSVICLENTVDKIRYDILFYKIEVNCLENNIKLRLNVNVLNTLTLCLSYLNLLLVLVLKINELRLRDLIEHFRLSFGYIVLMIIAYILVLPLPITIQSKSFIVNIFSNFYVVVTPWYLLTIILLMIFDKMLYKNHQIRFTEVYVDIDTLYEETTKIEFKE